LEPYLSEINDIKPLLVQLKHRLTSSQFSILDMESSLNLFSSMLEDLVEILRPNKGTPLKSWKEVTSATEKAKGPMEYLEKLKQFKSQVNSWLLLDFGCAHLQ
jgi:hypothetical protein